MKKLAIIIAGAAVTLAVPALAVDQQRIREEQADVRDAERDVQEDKAAVKKYENYLEQNRAEKARAKSEGAYGRQAKESVAIGANKAAISANKTQRRMDEADVERERRELREAREQGYNDMPPSSGTYREGPQLRPYYERYPAAFPQGSENRPGSVMWRSEGTDYSMNAVDDRNRRDRMKNY